MGIKEFKDLDIRGIRKFKENRDLGIFRAFWFFFGLLRDLKGINGYQERCKDVYRNLNGS